MATPTEMLVDGKKAAEAERRHPGADVTHGAGNGNLQGQYKLVEQTYAEDVLNLVLARGISG